MSIQSLTVSATPTVLLGTAKALVTDFHGNQHTIRLLLDPGAQGSFITESLANKLQLQRRRRTMTVAGIGSINTTTQVPPSRSPLTLHLTSRSQLTPTSYPSLPPTYLPQPSKYNQKKSHLSNPWPIRISPPQPLLMSCLERTPFISFYRHPQARQLPYEQPTPPLDG